MLQLPNELIYKIGRYTIPPRDDRSSVSKVNSTRRTLYSLGRTCKRFLLLRPLLFQTITYMYKDKGLEARVGFYIHRARFIRDHIPPGTVREMVFVREGYDRLSSEAESIINTAVTSNGRWCASIYGRWIFNLQDIATTVMLVANQQTFRFNTAGGTAPSRKARVVYVCKYMAYLMTMAHIYPSPYVSSMALLPLVQKSGSL